MHEPTAKAKTKPTGPPAIPRRLHALARTLAAEGRAAEASACRQGARKIGEVREYLARLTTATGTLLAALDAEMRRPSDADRGRRVAAILDALEMANDSATFFGLGIDFRTDRKPGA
jgi:hypothetical protein